jgi:dolichol kinase
MGWWVIMLAAGLTVIRAFAPRLPRIEARKLFHVLAAVLFVPATAVDKELLSLAYSGATAGLFVLEALRITHIEPIAGITSRYYKRFLDSRDIGVPKVVLDNDTVSVPMACTHFYLLIGCALPHWFAEVLTTDGKTCHVLGVGGVFTLGLGDATSAIAGRRLGHASWPWSHRTYVGSLAGVTVAAHAFAACVSLAMPSVPPIPNNLFASILPAVAVLEAVTTRTDNLVLPFFFTALVLASLVQG